MKIRPFPTKSLLLAPLASIPAATLAGLGSSDGGIAQDFLSGLVFSFLLAVPAAYLGMLIIGLPMFILLRKWNIFLLSVACATGAVVPYLLFKNGPFSTILRAVAIGLAVSITAYFLRPAETIQAR